MRIDFTVITSGHEEELPGQKQHAETQRTIWRALQELIPGYVHVITRWVDSFTKPPTPLVVQPDVRELLVLRDRAAFELGQKDRAAGRIMRSPAEITAHVTLALPAEAIERLAPGSGERLFTAYHLGYQSQVKTAGDQTTAPPERPPQGDSAPAFNIFGDLIPNPTT